MAEASPAAMMPWVTGLMCFARGDSVCSTGFFAPCLGQGFPGLDSKSTLNHPGMLEFTVFTADAFLPQNLTQKALWGSSLTPDLTRFYTQDTCEFMARPRTRDDLSGLLCHDGFA